MKNREKFAKEILDIVCEGGSLAVTKDNKVVNCDDVNCGQCLFYKTDDYGSYCDGNSLYRWAESEFVEKHTIRSKEKKFLDALLPKWNYIARDSNTNLYIYPIKPTRLGKRWMLKNDYYFYKIAKDVYGNMFDFIKWEDEEPWSIEDLKKLEVKDE